MARMVGIDYGEKRVGVAISDDSLRYGFARTVMPNDDTLLAALAEFAEYENADTFVIGASDNPRGGVNAIMRRITIFGDALQVRTGKQVAYVSEVFTSAEARRALEDNVKNRKDAKVPIDAAAAALILQTYLDTLQHIKHA